MPFVSDGDSPPPARNKRRWQDHANNDDGSSNTPAALHRAGISCSFSSSHHRPIAARKMAPVAKRPRVLDGHADDSHSHPPRPSHLRGLLQPHNKEKTTNTPASMASSTTTTTTHPRPSAESAVVLLAPCHICHRRPTKRTDLDSFARCEGCGAQTCFVCVRQCRGAVDGDVASLLSEQEALSRSFHMEDATDDGEDRPPTTKTAREQTKQNQGWAACGHRSVVCSRCCVEKGPEGEVVCLGCLFGDEASQDMMF